MSGTINRAPSSSAAPAHKDQGCLDAIREGWRFGGTKKDEAIQKLELKSLEEARMHFFSLRFNGHDVEEAFQVYYYRKSVNPCRISAALCLAFLVLFGALDEKSEQYIIRFGGLCPMALIAILVSFAPSFQYFMQVFMGSVCVAMGVGLAMISAMMDDPGFAGVLIILVYCHTFSKLRFVPAFVAGFLIIVSCNIVFVMQTESGTAYMVYFNFILATIEVNGLFVSYWFEYYIRKEFLLNARLRVEQKNLEEIVIMDFIDDARDVLGVVGNRSPATRRSANRVDYGQALEARSAPTSSHLKPEPPVQHHLYNETGEVYSAKGGVEKPHRAASSHGSRRHDLDSDDDVDAVPL